MKGMIIVPACNEGASLQKFLPRLHESLTKISEFNISVVVINDGSDDNTVQVAEECGCRVVTNKRNRGNGYSIRRGLQLALEERPRVHDDRARLGGRVFGPLRDKPGHAH